MLHDQDDCLLLDSMKLACWLGIAPPLLYYQEFPFSPASTSMSTHFCPPSLFPVPLASAIAVGQSRIIEGLVLDYAQMDDCLADSECFMACCDCLPAGIIWTGATPKRKGVNEICAIPPRRSRRVLEGVAPVTGSGVSIGTPESGSLLRPLEADGVRGSCL